MVASLWNQHIYIYIHICWYIWMAGWMNKLSGSPCSTRDVRIIPLCYGRPIQYAFLIPWWSSHLPIDIPVTLACCLSIRISNKRCPQHGCSCGLRLIWTISLQPAVLAVRSIGTVHMKFQSSTPNCFLACSELCVLFREAVTAALCFADWADLFYWMHK